MTVKAKYGLTEAHFRIVELEQALRDILNEIVASDGSVDSYDGTANPVIKQIAETALAAGK